jgi:hypothetical protein
MDRRSAAPDRHVPLRLAIGAGITACLALAGILYLDKWLIGQDWLLYAAAVPLYFLLQIFAEGVLEGFWSAHRWLAKLMSIIVVAAFYVLWIWLRTRNAI